VQCGSNGFDQPLFRLQWTGRSDPWGFDRLPACGLLLPRPHPRAAAGTAGPDGVWGGLTPDDRGLTRSARRRTRAARPVAR
jgi:hypothetical protein